MRKIWSYFILLVAGTIRGLNFVVAQVSIPLSIVPYLFGVLVIWVLQLITKIFLPLDGNLLHIYYDDYHEMIEKIKQKKYDELYDEMKKRENQDK